MLYYVYAGKVKGLKADLQRFALQEIEKIKNAHEGQEKTLKTSIPEEILKIKYDPAAGEIDTPGGVGKYIKFHRFGDSGVVEVEMDCMYAVEFDGSKCYVEGAGG